ncbi:hypothetical protein EVAR_76727_1 [Eumeta japonica]|uniref:Uncharacterized protein n=1 Tax=Eumeta variegata TaxID=151549 RepID=A0A4C1SVB4_EUMVA|nr:hypothetical protein EVAR_76727_1 [Eumeta japonica]
MKGETRPYINSENWFAEFKRDCISLSDEFRDGRLSIAVKNKNIEDVHPVVETDRYGKGGHFVNSSFVEEEFNLCPMNNDTIVHSVSTDPRSCVLRLIEKQIYSTRVIYYDVMRECDDEDGMLMLRNSSML